MMAHVAGPTAALAGVPAGLQAQGVWVGRRQLLVRFAAEAETATMYTAEALAQELKRLIARSTFHSVSVSGRDPLANAEYLCAAFDKHVPAIPMMLDTDGQRPTELGLVAKYLALIQVTLEGSAGAADASVERGLQSLRIAARQGVEHALVLAPDERTSDGQLLRIVEQAHGASDATMIVVHPPAGAPVDRDRRWMALLERASSLHGDVRFGLRLPPPVGTR
jgi:pyruvate-formate lyase-activating enzyme